jgi:hypothetical protein
VTAFKLITRGTRKDINYYIDLVNTEYITFLKDVIKLNEEKNIKKKYTS